MEFNAFKIIAIVGLLILVCGVLVKKDRKRNILFLIGGILMAVYSIYIGDAIIISLQIIFIFAARYKLFWEKK